MASSRYEQNTSDSGLLVKYWPIMSVLVAWAVAGLMAFGSVRSDIQQVNTELAAHEKAQQETINGMRSDLQYIRGRLDEVMNERAKK